MTVAQCQHDLIVCQVLTLCLVICTSAIHLYLVTQTDRVDFRDALNRGAGSAFAFSLSILVVWPVTALLAYHMRVGIEALVDWDDSLTDVTQLLLLNITTIEQVRAMIVMCRTFD